MKLIRKTACFFITLIVVLLTACTPVKTALELNNKKYSKIASVKNSGINTEGVYVLKDTLTNKDNETEKIIITNFIKFNANKTVQFSSKHQSNSDEKKITNENLTNWLNDYASSYYYTKNNSKLIVEHYIANPTRQSWYALDGPNSAPLKFKITFKINGDTLVKNKKKYILDKTLTNNHKTITTDFISLKK